MLEWILYIVAIVALIGMVTPSFEPALKQMTFSFVQRSKLVQESWLFRHLNELLYLKRKKITAGRFLYFTLLWFVGLLLTTFVLTTTFPSLIPSNTLFVTSDQMKIGGPAAGWLFSLFIACCSVGIRYLYLRISAHYERVQAGYDLYEIVKTLPRYTDLSIDDALLQTAHQLGSKNLLYRPIQLLSFCLTNYTRTEELDRETKRFIKTVDTTFAVAFISDMLYAHHTGSPWRDSLVKLGTSMELRSMSVLDAKKNFSDAIHMGLWGNLVALVGIVGGLCYMIGFRIYAGLQFQTFMGSSLMMLVLISILAGMIVALYLLKPRLDYR